MKQSKPCKRATSQLEALKYYFDELGRQDIDSHRKISQALKGSFGAEGWTIGHTIELLIKAREEPEDAPTN